MGGLLLLSFFAGRYHHLGRQCLVMCCTFVTFLRDNISLLTTSLHQPARICSFAHIECSSEKELILKYPAEGMLDTFSLQNWRWGALIQKFIKDTAVADWQF